MPLLPPGAKPPSWRTVALIEHHGGIKTGDPDFEFGKAGGDPATYNAIRISTRKSTLPGFHGPQEAVFVAYKNPLDGFEYYDIAKDPSERPNIANRLTPLQFATLRAIVRRLAKCRGTKACFVAGVPEP